MSTPLQGLSTEELEGFFVATAYVNNVLPIAIANCVGFGFFIGDWFSSFRLEFAHLVTSWRKPMSWAFVPTRIFSLIAQICYLLDLKIGLSNLNCGVNNKLLGAATVVAMGGAYTLLTLRCIALCSSSKHFKAIKIGLVVMLVGATLSFIAVPSQVGASKSSLGLTICDLHPIGDVECLPYFVAFAFDLIISSILIAAVASNQALRSSAIGQSRSIRSLLLSDTGIYLLIMSSLSLSCGILMTPSVNVPVYLKSTLTGVHLSVTTTLACRVTLNLRMLGHGPSQSLESNKARPKVSGHSGGIGHYTTELRDLKTSSSPRLDGSGNRVESASSIYARDKYSLSEEGKQYLDITSSKSSTQDGNLSMPAPIHTIESGSSTLASVDQSSLPGTRWI